MEPLTALGLAANVAQLMDLGISVVRNTKEIANAGSTISAVHLSNLADDIESASSSLTKNLKLESRSPESLSPEEKVGLSSCTSALDLFSFFCPFFLLGIMSLTC